ncbi:MAG: T9SS type A sorting domain-containing protein [Candidatus Cloacimonadaceae bacterium]|nr:T9SS type A sorting domain-containing protein [Candidatus Cloacimonadaceae bacterium]
MKSYMFCVFLILLMVVPLMGIPYEQTEEYTQKQAILNERAVRFKAETGFEGDITFNHQDMKFSQLYGIFNDIRLTAPQDTISAEGAFDKVLLKITPFISAREGQLIPSIIERSQYMVSKKWEQKINGYSVHPGGIISISYNIDTQEFIINDSTVDIPNTPIPINISKEDAKQIMINEYKKSEYYNGRVRGSSQEPSIAYNRISTSKDPLQYRLYWSMMFFQVSFSIDVETLEIHQHMNIMMYNMLAVKGKTYKPTISGLVFDPTTPPESSLRGINVMNGDQNGFTDPNGCIQLSLSPQENYKVSLRSERWDIRSIYNESNSLNVDYYTEIDPMSYETNVLDFIDTQDELNPAPPSLYAANIYYHLQNQDDFFTERSPSFSSVTYPVIYNDNEALPANDWGGVFEVNYNTGTVAIHYYNGFNPYIIMHELSHFYTFNRMNSLTFSGVASTMLDKAMDEAFAEYWLGRGLVTNSHIRNYNGNSIAIDLLDIYDIHSSAIYNNLSLTLNEDFYSWYYCGMPIAAVWEDIRTSLWFDDFDIKLLGALTSITVNDQDLSKPRYFYNVLMRTSTPNAQMIIDKAYSGRGFHFTPQVESYSEADRSRNVFSPGDQVHAKITKAPQNTPFDVYVIRHDDYTYVDGANVSTLTPHLASGFSNPITGNRTDNEGKWSGLIWTIPTELENVDGGYDIIVNFGSPEAPDNRIHFTYTAANVMDGFDGLHVPGFTVTTPTTIDIVLALDCSPSMSDRSQLARTARQFVGQLEDGDRVGVFGFAAEVGGNQYIQDVVINRIPSGSLGLTPILNNKDYLSGQGVITFPSNYPYLTYSTDMRTPFVNGYLCFDELARPKHFVTLSDGWHCLPNGTTLPDGTFHDPTNEIRSRLLYSYEPSGIQCHTMRYKAYPTNNDGDYPYNEAQSNMLMNRIAEWGNGSSWSRKFVNETYQDINAILDAIRQSSSSIDENRSYIGPNPAQDTEIIQFLVDKNAHSLVANFSINWFCTDTTGLIDFNLVSPSGIDVTLNPDNYHYYTSLGRVELPFPEPGLWEAIVTRPQSTSSVSSFSFSAKVQSDLEVHFTDPPRKHKMNVPLPLTVRAFEYLEPVTDAQVKVFLRRDDWFMELSLLDDGYHNDEQANDGIYGNYMYAYSDILQQFPHNAAGVYDLIFELRSLSLTAERIKKYRIELESPEDYPYASTERRLHSGWNWVGFPRLQRDESGTAVDYATISLSPFLTDVHSRDGVAEFRDNQWNYYGLDSLNSIDGYKLRMKDTTPVSLFELGTIIDTLMTHQLNEGQWNWVTYPCYETVYPWEALSGVIDRIDYIMAEKWSMKRDGDVWIYDGIMRPHLKYGDSVMIRTTRDCSFVWNFPFTTPQINEPQKPQQFVFEDKPNYETIMIDSIEGNPDYSEIGIFQDDVCIGARVFEAYPIQILAYSTPVDEGGGQLSFMLFSENKGAVSVSPATIRPGNYDANESTIEPEQFGFRVLTLKTNDQQTPSVLALHSNYPNPFNPSTTINFSLPTKAQTRLVIYNVRGQKVKVLLSDTLDCGNHSVVWNGRDDSNRPVASGIYFARLEQSGATKISKMMLMK